MNRKFAKPLLTGLAGILWLLLSMIGYYYTHKPFTATLLAGLLAALWQMLAVALILALAGGIGMLARLEKLSLPPLTLAVISATLGLGVIAIVFFVIGASIGINIVTWLVFAAVLILLRKSILRWAGLWRDLPALWSGLSWIGKFSLGGTAIILLCQLLVALAPPLQFDALTYHLSMPKAYLLQGRITYLPDIMFWGMPQLIESLYTLAMYFAGTEAATVLGWGLGLLAIIGLVSFSGSIFGADSAGVAAASLVSGLTLAQSLSSGYVEWASILYGFAMTAAIIAWQSRRAAYPLVMAGIFAGMALSTKYTSGIALLAGCTVILILTRPFLAKKLIISLGIFGLSAVLISLPWWIKNSLATGNPFYPLLFPSGTMDATRLAFYNFAPNKHEWSRLVLLPWQATIWGVEKKIGYSASIGPLLLGLSPLAWLGWKKFRNGQRDALVITSAMLVATFLVWTTASQFLGLLIQTRLYVAVFPAWALLCAAGFAVISELRAFNIRFWNIAGALIALALGFAAFETVSQSLSSGAFTTALRLEKQQTYLEDNLGWYTRATQVINALPQGSRVLMLWETRSFACLPKCDGDEIIDRWYHDIRVYRDPSAVLRAWREQGYTHLLYNRVGRDFIQQEDNPLFLPEDWETLDALLTQLPPPNSFGETYYLYLLDAP